MALPDYPFRSNFLEIKGTRIHYIDEGRSFSPTLIFLHGVPTWSFTFRKIFPLCLDHGFRVMAPDLPGFGMSEKLQNKELYSPTNYLNWMEEFIRRLVPLHSFLFGHDWGALMGMILAARNPGFFSGMILCNGYLPVSGQRMSCQMFLWKQFTRFSPILPVGSIVSAACFRRLTREERAGYDYPFQGERDKTAIRVLPQLISSQRAGKENPLFSWSWDQLRHYEKPVVTVFGRRDPITRGGERLIQSRIPGAKNQPHGILEGGHFLQEDEPDELASIICDFLKTNV